MTQLMWHLNDIMVAEKYKATITFVNKYNKHFVKLLDNFSIDNKTRNRFSNKKWKIQPFDEPVNYMFTKQWAWYNLIDPTYGTRVKSFLERIKWHM